VSVVDIKKIQAILLAQGIRVARDDPVFLLLALNETVLNESLERVGQIEAAACDVIASLPGVAKSEIEIASRAAITRLTAEVGQIAQRLAGDAAAAEKSHAISFAAKWTAAGVLSCAIVFGSVGYGTRMLIDEVNINAAREAVAAANEHIAATEKQAIDDVETAKKSIGWMGTQQGQLAKRFFDIGGGDIAARCDSPVWEIVNGADGKYCIPNRRDLLGGDKNKYGWKIP